MIRKGQVWISKTMPGYSLVILRKEEKNRYFVSFIASKAESPILKNIEDSTTQQYIIENYNLKRGNK